MNFFKNLFSKSNPEPIYVDVKRWEADDSVVLNSFLFDHPEVLKQLRAYHIELSRWATDVSTENYDNMKYRACVAYGAKIMIDKIIDMAKTAKKSEKKEVSSKQFDEFLSKRMNMSQFKSK